MFFVELLGALRCLDLLFSELSPLFLIGGCLCWSECMTYRRITKIRNRETWWCHFVFKICLDDLSCSDICVKPCCWKRAIYFLRGGTQAHNDVPWGRASLIVKIIGHDTHICIYIDMYIYIYIHVWYMYEIAAHVMSILLCDWTRNTLTYHDIFQTDMQ